MKVILQPGNNGSCIIDIYKAITYNFFETKMQEQERSEKVHGWNEAVEMLLKK